jgi:predicted DNA-binding ArsR family transcriptional regulator
MRETTKSRVETLEEKVIELECAIDDIAKILNAICKSQDEMHDEIKIVEKIIKGTKSVPVLPRLRKVEDETPN